MPQLSLYLDDATMKLVQQNARLEGLSLSRYVSSTIQQVVETPNWPEGYWNLYGSIEDDTFGEPELFSAEAGVPQGES